MSTAKAESPMGFVVWITGLPASGKSAVTTELAGLLHANGIEAEVLESDALRRIFSDRPDYDDAGRDYFYTSMAFIAEALSARGAPVIVDATANRRAYRDRARERIARFAEVYVACPLEVCIQRDPKGLYRRALADPANRMPGLGAVYEPPESPEVVIQGDVEPPKTAARRIIAMLRTQGFLANKPEGTA